MLSDLSRLPQNRGGSCHNGRDSGGSKRNRKWNAAQSGTSDLRGLLLLIPGDLGQVLMEDFSEVPGGRTMPVRSYMSTLSIRWEIQRNR